MELLLLPEPDEPTQRAVAVALARFPVTVAARHEVYASRWRRAGLAESVASGATDDEDGLPGAYRCSPRSRRGVTRA